MKAFKATLRGWPSGVSFAANAGKARYLVYRSAREIGYDVTFADIAIHRAPAYDVLSGYFLDDQPRHCSLEQVHMLLASAVSEARERS